MELVVTLAIFGIVSAIGAPLLGNWIRDNDVRASTRQMTSILRYARTEAVSRNANITVSTANASDDWSDTIDVYVDASGGNSAFDEDDDTLLKRFTVTGDPKIDLMSNNAGASFISFNNRGALNEGGDTISISVCDERGAGHGQGITISLVGRVSSEALEEDGVCNPI